MSGSMDGQVAIVAAASRGIGHACARAFAAEGARVGICGRHRETLVRVAEEMRRETGAEVLPVQADVSRSEDVEAFVEAVGRAFGRIDVLACNAGGPPAGGFAATSDERWVEGCNLVLLSAVRLIRSALPWMQRSGYGRIVVVASSSVKQVLPDLILSNVFRAGLGALVKSCAEEFGPRGILINAVCPGRILTDRVREMDATRATAAGIGVEEQMERTHAAIPLGRYGTPAEVAAAALFLCSAMNSYVTGQSLLVDGGLVRAT